MALVGWVMNTRPLNEVYHETEKNGLVSTWTSDDALHRKCRLGIEMLTLSVKYGSPAA